MERLEIAPPGWDRRLVAQARFALAVLGLVVWTLALAPFQWLFLRVSATGARRLPVLYHRGVARLMGIRIHVEGEIARARPLMLVANHITWIDIVVLSAVAPVSFIAKSEMITWPVFGWLARAQRTVFVDRADRRRAGEQADEIARRLEAGDIMVLFAEGTTSDGNRVLPFNASLLGAPALVVRRGVEDHVAVQPVALDYARVQGMAVGRHGMRRIGWPGEVGLMPHLPDVIREGALDVAVTFDAPIEFDAGAHRKQVAQAVRAAIREARSVDLGSHRD